MDNKDLFVLVYSHYEDYVPYYFWGDASSSQEDFQSLCDRLVDQAAFNAVRSAENSEYGAWVGWHDIVMSLIPLLAKEGYIQFEPKIKVVSGSGIIDHSMDTDMLGQDAAKAVIKYNHDMKSGMHY